MVKSNFTCLNSRMTREYGDVSSLCTIMLPEEAKCMLDAKAFLALLVQSWFPGQSCICDSSQAQCQLESKGRGRNFCSMCTCVKGDYMEVLVTSSIRCLDLD